MSFVLSNARGRWGGSKGLTLAAGVSMAMLAACAPPSADSGGSEAAEEGPIIVGAPMPLTGPYASDGQAMLDALEMAVAERNENGLLGRQLEVQTCDVAAMETSVSQACAERLLGENPHVVITGYDSSGAGSTLTYGQADVPYLHALTHEPAVQPVIDDPETYGNVFQYDPSETHYGVDTAEQLPKVAAEMGVDLEANPTVAIVKADYAYNKLGAERFSEEMESKGFEVVVDETTPFGVEDWGSTIAKIRAKKPAVVSFWNLSPADAARFISQLRRVIDGSGMESLVYMQYTPNIPEFLELAGENANGVVWSTVIGLSETAVSQETIDDYDQRWVERYGSEPNSIYNYALRDAFDIWATAVENANCAECFEDVNQQIREIEHDGFSGTYRFAEEGQYALPGENLIPTIWSQVQDGKNVRILPDNIADAEVQTPPWLS